MFGISLFMLAVTLQLTSQSEYMGGLHEGDILLTRSQQLTKEALFNPDDPYAPQNAVVRTQRQLWPNAEVPYVLDRSLNRRARSAIRAAIADYSRHTCIRFVRRTNQANYVRIFAGKGCFSNIGRTGGLQDMSIGVGCESKGIVMHEMFHALGRWHEQSRPDRGRFVKILTNNIESGNEHNFFVTNSAFVTTQGIPYDIGSIMHYSSKAFSRNGKPTIVPVDKNIKINQLGQRSGFSYRDLQHVRTLYCDEGSESTASWSSWTSWSSCSRNCNGGTRSRSRACNGGTNCKGSNIQKQRCRNRSCKVPAKWGRWSKWSGCSTTCGAGRQIRTRPCVGGNTCVGKRAQFKNCNRPRCPRPIVTGSWGTWSNWSGCSCGGKRRSRTRRCISGNTCVGKRTQFKNCNTSNCQ